MIGSECLPLLGKCECGAMVSAIHRVSPKIRFIGLALVGSWAIGNRLSPQVKIDKDELGVILPTDGMKVQTGWQTPRAKGYASSVCRNCDESEISEVLRTRV